MRRRTVTIACIVSFVIVACGTVLFLTFGGLGAHLEAGGAYAGRAEEAAASSEGGRADVPVSREDEILAAIEAALADARTGPGSQVWAEADAGAPEGEPVGEAGEPGEPFVVLEALSEFHPSWTRLRRLCSRQDEMKRSWQQYVDGARVSQAELARRQDELTAALSAFDANLPGCYEQQLAGETEMAGHALADFEASVRARAEDKVAVAASQIRSRLEDRIYVEEGKHARDVEGFEASVAAQFHPRLMALRLTLALGHLSRERQEDAEAEVAEIEAEIAGRVTDYRERARERLDKMIEGERAAAEQELASVKREAEEEAARSIAQERARMKELLESRSRERVLRAIAEAADCRQKLIQSAKESVYQRQAALSQAVRDKESAVLPELAALGSEIESLCATISADVDAAIVSYEREAGRRVRVVRRDDARPTGDSGPGGAGSPEDEGARQVDVLGVLARILIEQGEAQGRGQAEGQGKG